MGTGKTYSTKYLLDSNNNSGVAGQVLSTTSTGIDWVDANTVPGTGLWLESGNDIYNSNSGNVAIGVTTTGAKLQIDKANANSSVIISRSGTNIGVSTSVGSITSPSHYNSSYTDYAAIQAYSNASSALRGSLDLKVKSTSGNLLTGLTVYGTSSGVNVGIGTTSPTSNLEIQSAGTADSIICLSAAGNSAYYSKIINSVSSGRGFAIQSQGTDAFVIAGAGGYSGITIGNALTNLLIKPSSNDFVFTGGNVGIGTTGPSDKLTIEDSGEAVLSIYSTDTGVVDSQKTFIKLYGENGLGTKIEQARISTAPGTNATSAGQLIFSTGSGVYSGGYVLEERIRIDESGNVGIGTASPGYKLEVKDGQDSSLFSGLVVERSANTTAVCLNAVGGALNLNTNSSIPLKFRIQNTSMQTINTNGGRAYAGFGGWRMFEYSYTVSVGNGATVDLFQNTSAHSDLHMVQIAIRMWHSGRTYFVGSGTVGGYGMNIIGSGIGATNGGLTSALVSSGIRKLQISQSSGYTAAATIYIQFRLDSGSGINVLNGTLSSL